MLVYEFRIPLPLSLAEYQIGQLFTVAEMSLDSTGGGEGVEVLVNEPFKNQPQRLKDYNQGTFTYKIYRMESRIPSILKLFVDAGKCAVHEESWNCFPYCRTILTNPGYLKEKFFIDIESVHVENSTGEMENALQLPKSDLDRRQVVYIDIGNDPFTSRTDVKYDPSVFVSTKTNRGPLQGNWIENMKPMMTCYKVVRTVFKVFGIQNKIERFVEVNEQRLFTQFHRQMFCTLDSWINMSMTDIRRMEDEVKDNLKAKLESEARASTSFTPNELYETYSKHVFEPSYVILAVTGHTLL